MKIAAAQTVVAADIAANAEVIRSIIYRAAADKIRLVSFCEGALSGYSKAQIASPGDWQGFNWDRQEVELRSIARLCQQLGIHAVIGAAHRAAPDYPPYNSLILISETGDVAARYDKRFLSNSELAGWYTPGLSPLVFDIDGYRFGCAICIESQFPEVFIEYERMGVDAVLFSSYGIPEHFQVALRAHAGLNCLWISAATPAQEAEKGAAGIVGPDGKWAAICPPSPVSAYVATQLDRNDPQYHIALHKARPWRAKARLGNIYREKMPVGVA